MSPRNARRLAARLKLGDRAAIRAAIALDRVRKNLRRKGVLP